METSFRTIVHRFGISQGLVQERPRGITVLEGAAIPASRRQRGAMYILIDVLGGLPDPDYVVERLALAMQNAYYQAVGSVTGGIGAALRAANDWLFEENLNSPREQRGVAGVSCAVLRDGDLYLGQMGPALAYLMSGDGVRRFPEDSPWLRQAVPSDAERTASPPLGVRRVIEPAFYHATPDAGDVFVLASPALSRLVPGEAIARAIAPGGEAARRNLQMLVSGQDVAALIVTLAAAEPAVAGYAAQDLPLVDQAEEEPEPAVAPPPPLRPAALAPRRPQQMLPQPLAQAGRGLLDLMRRTLPERARAGSRPQPGPITPTPLAPPGRTANRAVAALAILLPVLAIVLVLAARFQYEQSRRQRVATYLRQAEEARTQALAGGDQAGQRQGLRQALGFVDQALTAAPEEPQALDLRRQIVDKLDEVSGVRRLYTLWELVDLPPTGATPARATRLIVRGADLFLLDRGTGRAYRRQLNPAGDALEPLAADAALVRKGQTVGSIAVGELIDMVWMPAGGERTAANLMVLERNGSLIEWDPVLGANALPVADSAAWKKPAAGGAYAGNFYLLDPQANRILKYLPAGNDYTNPPTDYVLSTGVDLAGAVDMGIDGHIYVLLADGKVLNFLAGKLQPFTITGLDEPLQSPVAMCVTGEDPERGSVYIADAGLARVVQLNKQGQFIAQFKAEEGRSSLAELSGLFVDEAAQRIYLASGPKVYMAPLSAQAPTPLPAPGG